jgi:methionine-rich copper-binding protein CopC
MKSAFTRMLIILLTLSLLVAACSPNDANTTPTATSPSGAELPTTDPNALQTSVAQTVEAELTQVAVSNPTNTPAPSPTSSPPPLTEAPTEPLVPTATGVGSVSTTEGTLANHARFIEDVSIPDGTLIVAGDLFTKTWRIQNIGSESWVPGYFFVFINGDRMEGQAITLTQETAPGATIDVSVPMTAPLEAGTYIGYWMFQAPDTEEGEDGAIFGIGANATQALYVQINVILPTPSPTPTLTPTNTPVGATPAAATPTPTPGPSVVNVSLGVDGNSFVGTCPATLTFNAVVTLDGPLTFNYRVNALANDANYTFSDVPADTIESTQQGDHTVTLPFTLSITETVSGQISFEITSPSNVTSPPILFVVTCQ